MNKLTTLIFTFSLLFILTGCTKTPKNTGTLQDPQQEMEIQKDTGIVKSVIEALNNNKVLKCLYIDEDGEKTPTYIKGNKVYVVGTDDDGKENELRGLVTNDKYYLWSVETNEGAVMDLVTEDEEDAIEMNGKKIRNSQEMIEYLEKNSQNCEYSAIDNSVFELPDIEFMPW